jgi:hypothetical protein
MIKFKFLFKAFIVLTSMVAFLFVISATVKPRQAAIRVIKKSSPNELFNSDEVLQITLKGNLRNLLNDRTDKPKDFPFVLSFPDKDNSEINIPVQVKTRGHFRRMKENCLYPPILIEFIKDSLQKQTIFKDQKKLKLVMPCMGDEFVIREWLVYKLYNLVTPKSFKARLVKVKLEDDKNKKSGSSFYGILLEEEKQMAKRNKMVSVNRRMQPTQIETNNFLSMTVFQYLIGNTDWSIQYLQNIKLLAADSNAVPVSVPYDFDHAGIVNAPYAKPAEELLMSSIRQRRYRGYCIQDMKVFDAVLTHYNQLKNDIYSLYNGCTLIDQKYLKSTIQFLDEFYATINNPKAWQKEFAYPCDKKGTGNVVIKGLKED